jgi:hypothetical protein
MVGVKIRLFPSNNHLCDNGYTKEEESEIYDALLQDVIDNPRWYLDNLHSLRTFRVSWMNYGEKRRKITPRLQDVRTRDL